ncbi:MAG: deoxyribonuclease V [Chloroflexi bacterium]|nr:deoxyribonuclease V [Chloroflexota bacterium]
MDRVDTPAGADLSPLPPSPTRGGGWRVPYPASSPPPFLSRASERGTRGEGTSPARYWTDDPAEAIALQRALATRVVRENQLGEVRRIAGVDVAAGRFGEQGRASVVVLDYPSLAVVEVASVDATLRFPYIPGLLSFRELPAVLDAFARLSQWPDLALVDGHGIAHPRRFGIASHLGVATDLPTIGCAKSRLVGTHEPVPDVAGATVPLSDGSEVIGAVVRTRVGAKPLYVSSGHRVDLPSAVHWTLACCRGYRLPEPTRLAHLAAGGKLLEMR